MEEVYTVTQPADLTTSRRETGEMPCEVVKYAGSWNIRGHYCVVVIKEARI